MKRHTSTTYKIASDPQGMQGRCVQQCMKIDNFFFIITNATVLILNLVGHKDMTNSFVRWETLDPKVQKEFCEITEISPGQIIEAGDTTLTK